MLLQLCRFIVCDDIRTECRFLDCIESDLLYRSDDLAGLRIRELARYRRRYHCIDLELLIVLALHYRFYNVCYARYIQCCLLYTS